MNRFRKTFPHMSAIILILFFVYTSHTVKGRKVILKSAEAKIELPDQTISEVLVKRFKPGNETAKTESEVLLHKIVITGNGSHGIIPMPINITYGQPVFIQNSSIEIPDYLSSPENTTNVTASFTGRRVIGLKIPNPNRTDDGSDTATKNKTEEFLGRAAVSALGREAVPVDNASSDSTTHGSHGIILMPINITYGQPVFIQNSSIEIPDYLSSPENTTNVTASFTGRRVMGLKIPNPNRTDDGSDTATKNKTEEFLGRAAVSALGREAVSVDNASSDSKTQKHDNEEGEEDCDDYYDDGLSSGSASITGQFCWKKDEFDKKMGHIRTIFKKNRQPCPRTLPCREWSTCLYLWPTGLVTKLLAINKVGAKTYFDILYDGIQETVKSEIFGFVEECYKIYGLLEPFEGSRLTSTNVTEKTSVLGTSDSTRILTGLKNCRARILDIQECIGYGVWKVMCSTENED